MIYLIVVVESLTGLDIFFELYRMKKLAPRKRPLLSIEARKGTDIAPRTFCALRLDTFVSLLDQTGKIERVVANFTTDTKGGFKFIWLPQNNDNLLNREGIQSVNIYSSRYRRPKLGGSRIRELLSFLPEPIDQSSLDRQIAIEQGWPIVKPSEPLKFHPRLF